MLKIIGIVIAVLAVLVIYASTKPDMFHVERTVSIKAAPDKLFPLINDFQQWPAWSPYEKLDPAMKKRFSGAAAGAGSVYEWEGNSKAGAGRVTITDTTPPNKLAIKLEMFKPFAGTNDVVFTLRPRGVATDVTWAMDGRNTLLSKVMSLFFSMDKMVGGQFEEGLNSLKAQGEK
jgi:uncharacterized protein YndB with AHSA1/START domain